MPKNMNIAEMLQRLEGHVAYKHTEVSGSAG